MSVTTNICFTVTAALSDTATHLLDSWMRAMAMRILVRRKMRVRRRMASTTDMMITDDRKVTKHHTCPPHSHSDTARI